MSEGEIFLSLHPAVQVVIILVVGAVMLAPWILIYLNRE